MLDHKAGQVLRKLFCRTAAAFAIGRETISDKEVKETFGIAAEMQHYQVGFPKATLMHDVSNIVPIKQTDMGSAIPDILKFADELARKYWDDGKTPVMFAFYLRILDGTQGGLSVTAHEPGEKVLAFEFVTHPDAPGLAKFQAELVSYIEKRLGRTVKGHPGKEMPVPERSFVDEFPAETITQVNKAVDAVANLSGGNKSLFMTDYLAQMLGRQPMPAQVHSLVGSDRGDKLSDDEARRALAVASELALALNKDMFDASSKHELVQGITDITSGKSIRPILVKQ
jgi:hypothetical protein